MEQFVSIIVFSVPGLLVYFWIQAFGLNPTVKHNSTELIAISALFWVPTVLMSILTYNAGFLVIDWAIKVVGMNLSFLGLGLIKDLSGVEQYGTNLAFILFFFILSLGYSYIVARIWSKVNEKLISIINDIRLKRKLSKLSDSTSVWDEFFFKLDSNKEESLNVEVFKIGDSNKPLVGSVTRMSRPFEQERALVLEKVQEMAESHNYYKYKTKRTYIDTKSGIVVSEIDLSKPTENIDTFTSLVEELSEMQEADSQN
jgi:hypothetical protein